MIRRKINLAKLAKKVEFQDGENCVFRLIARESGSKKVSKEAIQDFFSRRGEEFPEALTFFKEEGIL